MSESLLRARANFKRNIRELMSEQGLIEVDVPLLYPHVCPDRHVEPISVMLQGRKLYLQPSPELNLKKIIAKSPLDCYSLNYAYRADPCTDLHHPEFMMLELYLMGERYADTQRLTTDVIELLCGPRRKAVRTYKQVWSDILARPYEYSRDSFTEILLDSDIPFDVHWDLNSLEDLIFGMKVQPMLGQGCIDIISGFPLHQSALAIIDTNGEARRYEVFIDGMEVANGYDELADKKENTQRFYAWRSQRLQDGCDPCDPIDHTFLDAMDSFPRCAGVAIGIDRIMMRALGCDSLKKTIPFYWHA